MAVNKTKNRQASSAVGNGAQSIGEMCRRLMVGSVSVWQARPPAATGKNQQRGNSQQAGKPTTTSSLSFSYSGAISAGAGTMPLQHSRAQRICDARRFEGSRPERSRSHKPAASTVSCQLPAVLPVQLAAVQMLIVN
jgi:hypothetical protein